MSDPYLGEIRAFGFNYAPVNWAFCNGQTIPISQNTGLFSLLGDTFGGNGRTDFGIPNLMGRAAIHTGTGPGLTNRRLGQMGGQTSVTLTAAQIPGHNHGLNVDNQASQESTNPAGRFISGSENTTDDVYLPEDRAEPQPPTMNNQFVAATGGHPHENRQPFLVMYYCICMDGIWPSRS